MEDKERLERIARRVVLKMDEIIVFLELLGEIRKCGFDVETIVAKVASFSQDSPAHIEGVG